LVLQSLAAAEITNIRYSQDFRSPSIFNFFNSTRHERYLKIGGANSGSPNKVNTPSRHRPPDRGVIARCAQSTITMTSC